MTEISEDARLAMLYNAALKLADVALRKAVYRAASGGRQHYYIIASLPQAVSSPKGQAGILSKAMSPRRFAGAWRCSTM